jgi:hypothetical protein
MLVCTINFADVISTLAFFVHRLSERTWFKVAFCTAIVAVILVEASAGRNDLDIFLAASSDIFLGNNVYASTYFDGYHYYYSVFFASVIYPLTFLPPFLSKLVWLSFNVFLIARIIKLVLWFFDDWKTTKEIRTLLIWLSVIFCLRFLKGNLHLGQLTILMLAISLEAMYRAYKNQFVFGSFLLALAINIKLLPIVLIPYLIYRAQWKMVMATLGSLVVLYFLPAVWFGFKQNYFLLSEWWVLVNPNDQRHIIDLDESSFHSLTTLCAALFTDSSFDPVGLQTKWNIACLTNQQLFALITSVRLTLVIFALWFLRSMPFVGFGSKEKTWWEISYLLLVVPLIFPHQQHYAFLMALPAVVWLLYWLLSLSNYPSNVKSFTLAVLVVYLTFNLSLLLGVFNSYYNHFKIVTFGALILVLLLACARPDSQIDLSN